MRYCHQCGTAMGDADQFCPSCGAKAEYTSGAANAGSQAYGTPGSRPGGNASANTGYQKSGNSSANAGYQNSGNASANTNYQSAGNSSANAEARDRGPAQQGTAGQGWQAEGRNAGAYADPGAYRTGFQYDPVGTVDTLVMKMRTLSTAWLIIGIIQIVIGTVGLCVIAGLAPLIMGIYNVIQSSKLRKQAESFQQWPVGIVPFFEARETSVIVVLILNIFFGLIFGIVGSVLEFTTKGYAMDHREDLQIAEDMANRSAQMG